jgi:hypothetical protein
MPPDDNRTCSESALNGLTFQQQQTTFFLGHTLRSHYQDVIKALSRTNGELSLDDCRKGPSLMLNTKSSWSSKKDLSLRPERRHGLCLATTLIFIRDLNSSPKMILVMTAPVTKMPGSSHE